MSKDQTKKVGDKQPAPKMTIQKFLSSVGLSSLHKNVIKKMYQKDTSEKTFNGWLDDCKNKKILGQTIVDRLKK